MFGSPPFLHLCRIGPGFENQLARRVQRARDGDLLLTTFFEVHPSSPSFLFPVFRADFLPGDRAALPRTGDTVRPSRRPAAAARHAIGTAAIALRDSARSTPRARAL